MPGYKDWSGRPSPGVSKPPESCFKILIYRFTRCFPDTNRMSRMNLTVLDTSEIERLHQATLEVFQEPGVRIAHPGLLERLRRAGARVDAEIERVRFPRQMVSELLRQAPSTVRLARADGRRLLSGGSNRIYTSLVLDPWIIDYEKGPRRPTLEDVRRHTILGDALPRVDGLMRMQYPVSDIAGKQSYLRSMEVFLSNTTKHILVYADSAENAREWLGAGEILCGGAGLKNVPLMTMAVAVSSPLTLHHLNGELLLMALEYNLPVIPTVCPMAGSTSPYTVAGTMLLANVETLLPVLIAQALQPGHPVFYMIGPSTTDLRLGHDLYYKAEKMLYKIMAVQMGRYYGLPVAGETAGTMTWRYDPQNGAEGMLYLLASVAGGQHLFGGLGSCYNALGMSAEQMVLQTAMIEQAEYVAGGVNLEESELGLASIRAAGPGGHFLTDELTLQHLRGGQFFQTPLFDYTGGSRPSAGAVAMAHEQVEQLVRSHSPAVSETIRRELSVYFQKLCDAA